LQVAAIMLVNEGLGHRNDRVQARAFGHPLFGVAGVALEACSLSSNSSLPLICR
jgi:hypothetical protein